MAQATGRPLEADRDPVVGAVVHVAQEPKRPVELADHDVHVAVAVEIAEHGGAVAVRAQEPRPRVLHHLEAAAGPPHHERGLLVVGIHGNLGGLRIDVAVEHHQVLRTVVVQVHERGRPAEERAAGSTDAELGGAVVEERAVEVQVERVGVAREVGGEDVGETVRIHVADRDSHGGLRRAVDVGGHAAHHAALLEAERSAGYGAVGEEGVRLGVVAHQDVRPAIAVEVHDGEVQPEARDALPDSRRFADIAERAVAAILVEEIGTRRQPARTGHHRDALERGGRGRVRGIEVEVVDDEEVEVPVAIEVGEARARGPARISKACLRGHILEPAATHVSQQDVRPVAAHVDVVAAIAVVVAHGAAEAPPGRPGTHGRRDIPEMHAAQVLEEPRTRAVLGIGKRGAVGHEDVHVAVAVEIDQRKPAALHLQDLLRGERAARHHCRQSAAGGDVFEPDGGRGHGLRGRLRGRGTRDRRHQRGAHIHGADGHGHLGLAHHHLAASPSDRARMAACRARASAASSVRPNRSRTRASFDHASPCCSKSSTARR